MLAICSMHITLAAAIFQLSSNITLKANEEKNICNYEALLSNNAWYRYMKVQVITMKVIYVFYTFIKV